MYIYNAYGLDSIRILLVRGDVPQNTGKDIIIIIIIIIIMIIIVIIIIIIIIMIVMISIPLSIPPGDLTWRILVCELRLL